MNGACHSSSATYYALYMVYIDFYRNLHNHVWHLFIDACVRRQEGEEKEGEGEKRMKRITYFHMLLTRFTAILVAAPRYCCCCCVLALCGLWGSVANDFTTFYGIVRCIRNKVSFHFIFLREHRENIVNKSQSNDSTNCKLLAAVWQPQVASNYNAVSHILNYEINRNLSGNFNLPAGGRQAGKGGGIKAAWLLICKQL